MTEADRIAAVVRALEDADDAKRIVARQAGQLGNGPASVTRERAELFVRSLSRLGYRVERIDVAHAGGHDEL